MHRTIASTCIGLVLTLQSARAAEPVKLTIQLRGAVTDTDAEVLQKTLRSADGIDIGDATVERGPRGPFGHHFSPPIEIELSDPDAVDVGALAETVSAAETPSRRDVPPSLNLVIFDRRAVVDEDDIGAIREAVRGVNGIDPDGTGTIGGVPVEGTYWIRIDDSGDARIDEIVDVLREASLEYRLLKP